MGRPRVRDLDFPQRVQFKHGKFYYLVAGKWLPLGADRAGAFAKADALNEASRAQRMEAFAAARKVAGEIGQVVMQRDGSKCVYCGAAEGLELDHVIPFSKGGATSIGNLVVSCMTCNASKNDGTIAEFMVKLHRVVERCLDAAMSRDEAPGAGT